VGAAPLACGSSGTGRDGYDHRVDEATARDLVSRARQLRENAGLTLAVAGTHCGISPKTLAHWERRVGDHRNLPAQADHWLTLLQQLDRDQGRSQ
jgi:DNA-binding transcriptional regulator YiaG